jgi:POT family proton-dependent oligopeptide transporter
MAIEPAFLFALLALLLGVGAFKGNIATQLGALYGPNDLRRAMAFQIFYIFINVSVIAAPLVSGTLGQKVGWHYGFGCAGVVMVLGLAIYLSGRRYLPVEDRAPARKQTSQREPMTRDDWRRVFYLLFLIPILAVALLTNQQIFNAYLTWGDQHFDLTLLNHTSSWLLTVDAAVSFSMLVAVAAFWKWWGARHREPDEIGKMIIGSVFTVAGGLCLFMAALTHPANGVKIILFWPMMFELMNSIGFAHVLPISLALFSKIAPKRITSTVIGLYYLSFFIANAVVGYVGGLYSSLPTTTFWLIHVASAAFGLAGFVVFKIAIGHRMGSRSREPATAG